MFDGVLPQAGRPQQEGVNATMRESPWLLIVLVSTIAILSLLAAAIYPEAFSSRVDQF
jgi:hypothetical protein